MNEPRSFSLLARLLFWAFVAALATPTALMLAGQGGFSPETENRPPAPLPSLNGQPLREFPRAFEAYFNDAFGLRAAMIKINAKIHSRLLRGTITPDVVAGRDGWLFYKGEHVRGTPQSNLQIFLGTYPLEPDFLEKARSVQARLRRYFEERGIRYYLVLVPSKISVYPEYMRGGKPPAAESAIDVVARYLQDHGEPNVVNLRPGLLRCKEQVQIYHRMDTHWNDEGMVCGSRILAERLDLPYRWERLLRDPGRHSGDLAKMAGKSAADGIEPATWVRSDPEAARPVADGPLMERLARLSWLKDATWKIYENPGSSAQRLVCLGDSFFMRGNFTRIFAEAFSFSAFIWNDHVAPEYLEWFQPDVVIWEVTERRMRILADPLDPRIPLIGE
jgi:hypothetical protein